MTRDSTRRYLDDWKFWMTVAYFAIVGILIFLLVVSGKEARTEAAHHADIIAAADAQYEQCIKSIPTLTRINEFIKGVQDEHATLLTNSLANHAATPPGSDLYRTQIANIARLRRANDEVKHVKFPVPTPAECKALKSSILNRF